MWDVRGRDERSNFGRSITAARRAHRRRNLALLLNAEEAGRQRGHGRIKPKGGNAFLKQIVMLSCSIRLFRCSCPASSVFKAVLLELEATSDGQSG
jgi:hypothetical protein